MYSYGRRKISPVDTSGVIATALRDLLCEGRQLTLEDIECVYHKKLATSPEELLEVCNDRRRFVYCRCK